MTEAVVTLSDGSEERHPVKMPETLGIEDGYHLVRLYDTAGSST